MARRVVRHAVTQPLDTSYRLIALTQNQNTIVDADDYEWLSEYCWHARWESRGRSFLACTNHTFEDGSRTVWKMHRLILGCGPGEEGDHKNHDTLDNRRENLRKCTASQNKQNKRAYGKNTSGYKGVHWKPKEGKWMAQIQVAKKKIYIGRFDSKEEAARSYDKAAKRYFGKFAFFNFPCNLADMA